MPGVGYMLNTYDEHGPENIHVFGPDADLRAALVDYCVGFGVDPTHELKILDEWLADDDRKVNYAFNLSDGWGGVQITELHTEDD